MKTNRVDAVHARYPVGEPVKVAVNPADPEESVLEPGVDLDDSLWPAFGLLLVLGGLLPDRTKGRHRAKSAEHPPERIGSTTLVETAGISARRPRYATAKTLMVIGAAVLLFGSIDLYKGLASLAWPIVEGKVVHSATQTGRGYYTLLWYDYHVQGARYVAGNYHTGGNSTPFEDVAKTARARYPVGKMVKVSYNPSNPAEAVLEPGVWYGNLVLPSIGLLILGIALLARKYADSVWEMDQKKKKRIQV